MSFKIIVNFNKYEIKDNKNIFSEIYVKVNSFYFPSDDWTDFTTVILSWWKREIIDLINGNIEFGELLFMEGSYKMWVHKNSDMLKVDFVNDRYSDNKIEYTCNVSIKDFILQISKCYKQIIDSKLLEKKYLDIFQDSLTTINKYI